MMILYVSVEANTFEVGIDRSKVDGKINSGESGAGANDLLHVLYTGLYVCHHRLRIAHSLSTYTGINHL